jgi:DNA-binding NarL/FixJ family response regulator
MESRIHVFLVAGNRLLREALARILKKRSDLEVAGSVPYSPEVLEQVAESGCDVLLMDSVTNSLADMDFLRDALARIPGVKVLLVGMERDETLFLRAVRAGAAGYVLTDASSADVVAAVRAVAQDEAVCPPSLCRVLFRHVARQRDEMPNIRVRIQLGLTRREQQLVPLIAQGLTNKEIAGHLNISEQTVKNHIHRMLQKVGASDRLSVVEVCRSQGFDLQA